MRLHFGVDLLQPEWTGCTACMGTFDGVHLGHQALLARTVLEAKKFDRPPVVITFDRHPSATLHPASKPAPIATLDQNLALFAAHGIAVAVVLPFDQAMAATTAEEFLERILRSALKVEKLVVGHDFAMGHGRVGSAQWLSEHLPTAVVNAVSVESERVSSSAIRKALIAGEVGRARTLLGRPYALAGVVVGGQKLGRTIGYPTANLARTCDQIVPKDGVYAGALRGIHGTYKAAISVGMRPAVGGKHRTVEAYLLDYPGDSLYGQDVELDFWLRLRDEMMFDSLDALKAQIEEDVNTVAAVPGAPAVS